MTDEAPLTADGADQGEVFAFLAAPATHGGVRARRIDTHGAAVFLVGSDAYKVKRAVRFPFMDFSTLEKRRAACEAEIAINKPNAPDIYLDAVPIVRAPGGLSLGGEGEIVEWAVHMRRFDEERTLDRLADAGRLTPETIARLAPMIVRSHARAPRRDGAAATDALGRYLDQNEAAFAAAPALFDPVRNEALGKAARAALATLRPLLLARGAAGYVRRCHGDLHLRNIALIDGRPTLFDAVEFDDEVATGDVLYDLAFLLMDLEERRLRPLANLLFNRYLWLSDEAQLEGLAALPFFLSLRAAIRAKVVAAGRSHLSGEARTVAETEAQGYFDLAQRFLTPEPARLVAVGGLSGTGKSALSAHLAPTLGRAPGAVWLRSDIERKRLFGAQETERLPQAAYDEAAGRQVYETLFRKASAALRSGQSVIVDAVFSAPQEKGGVESAAAACGGAFSGLWLQAPLKTRLERVTQRADDASDADAAVAAAQIGEAPQQASWRRIDASGDLDAVALSALRALAAPAS